MSIPEQWRGPFSPRDPLRQPLPGSAPPTQETPQRVEQERAAFQQALDALGGRLRGQAQ